MFWRRYGIYVLLAAYVGLASTYSIVTPIMEASDELWHYPMVKYIADHWSLPVQDPGVETPWRQEGSQPPLYYFLGAVLTAWIDTSDLERVRWLNPHADNGIITEDGNTNLIVHQLGERFSWRGTVLAIHLIRFASVCMGAGTVYLTYLLLLEVWPERTGAALGAAAITAFNPMFCFISGAVNNDNLAMLLCAAGIWLLERLVKRHGGKGAPARPVWRRDITVLGVVLGLGVLTKTSAMVLLPLTAVAVAYISWKRRSWSRFLSGGVVTAGLVALIAGWWFVRNAVLYDGDWLGLERFIVILGYRVPPATLRQLWGERHGFMMAYWGLFGGVNVPMPGWVYAVLNGALLVSTLGLSAKCLIFAVSKLKDLNVRSISSLQLSDFQSILLFLWPVGVLISWAGWATKTWSSQGRLVFSAISAWSVWMTVGLSQFLRGRWSALLPGALGAFLLALAAWVPFGVIEPAYRPPILPAGVDPTPEYVLQADIGGQVRLLGYDVEGEFLQAGVASAQPGQAVRFSLYWEAQRETDRDWSIFCHILDLETELVLKTRDRYPGQGLLATSLMEPGQRWIDRYVVWLPETAFAPSDAVLEVGLYQGDERPPILVERAEGDVQVVGNALRFQPLRIEPWPGVLPNPVYINFEDKLALIGWDVDRRMLAPGEIVQVTFYWECLSAMETSYRASAQVLGADRGKAAQSDVAPGGVDTSSWERGQQIVDRRELTISPDARAGGYEILISVYGWETPEQLKRLRIINSQGRVLPRDSWVLGQVKVASSE